MSQALAKKETTLPEAPKLTLSDQGFNSKDILIPRLMLAQNTSEAVGDGKAKLGDVFNSLSGEILAGLDTTTEIIPIQVYKNWRIYDMSDEHRASGGKLLRVDPFTPDNAEQRWEGTEVRNSDSRSVPVRRDLCYNAFVLLVKELREGFAFPSSLIFRRSSLNAGKQLISQVYKLEMMNRPIFARSVFLGSERMKNGTNTYAVFSVKPGQEVSSDDQKIAAGWATRVAAEAPRVDDHEAQAPVRSVTIPDSAEDVPF